MFIQTALSNVHKMTWTLTKVFNSKQKAYIAQYRDYKIFQMNLLWINFSSSFSKVTVILRFYRLKHYQKPLKDATLKK